MKKYLLIVCSLAVLAYSLWPQESNTHSDRVSVNSLTMLGEATQTKEMVSLEVKAIEPLNSDDNYFVAKIKRFKQLEGQVLKGADDKSEYQKMLSDSKLIRKSYLQLVTPNANKSLDERIESSMLAIDYFSEALAWQGNPKRQEIIEKVKYILLTDIVAQETEVEVKRARAGDQVELYQTLVRHAPNVAQQVRKNSRGTRLGSLIAFAEATIK